MPRAVPLSGWFSSDTANLYSDLTSAQAAALRSNYRISYRLYVPSLAVFLLVKTDQLARQHAPKAVRPSMPCGQVFRRLRSSGKALNVLANMACSGRC